VSSTVPSDQPQPQEGDTPGGTATPVPPVVTLAALYGAGGSVVGPRVAERLGVSFLDRGILADVANQLRIPEKGVAAYDSESPKEPRSGTSRFYESLGRITTGDGTPASNRELDEARYRSEVEAFLARASVKGGVVLGRGGAVVLRSVPGALHVWLGGLREARVRQAMRLEGVDQPTAERRLEVNDRARREYVRRAYGVEPEDIRLYHLVIDSTAIDLDTCVELIVAAAKSRVRQATGSGGGYPRDSEGVS
jgi:cytidylate kinase